ncbi:MAG: hypothetical protein EBV86_18220 [Marivivens sp.]|nr:hypothetical protein [Marivivens sp.]
MRACREDTMRVKAMVPTVQRRMISSSRFMGVLYLSLGVRSREIWGKSQPQTTAQREMVQKKTVQKASHSRAMRSFAFMPLL